MKRIKIIIGAIAFAFAGAVFANGQMYLGATLGLYDLDGERTKISDLNSINAGVQLGKYLTEDVAIELGYGVYVGHDDFDVASLNAILWLGDESGNWRPYVLGGFNHYDIKVPTKRLSLKQDEKSEQLMIGLGLGRQFEGDYEFRADVRGMSSLDDIDAQDLGFQISLNKLFQ